jgi:hypothetical protein
MYGRLGLGKQNLQLHSMRQGHAADDLIKGDTDQRGGNLSALSNALDQSQNE